MKSLLPIMAVLGLALPASAAETPAPAPQVTFALLAKTTGGKDGTAPRYPKALADLEGRKVRVSGWVSPYDQHLLMLRKFIVTPEENHGCYSCNPPDANGVVLVRLPAKGLPMRWNSDKVTVEGVLRLKGGRGGWKDPESPEFFAVVEEATVVARK